MKPPHYRRIFVRIKCCNEARGEAYLTPFSCKSRGLYSLCIQCHAIELEIQLLDKIIREVPYRQLRFCNPESAGKKIMLF